MRISLRYIAFGAALAATPALAQVNVGLGGQAGAGLGVGVSGGGLGGVTGALDRTIDRVDRTANGAFNSELKLATSADLTAGATIRDARGARLGVLQSVHGDAAMIVKGDRMLHVPLASLYRDASGLVTSLSKSQLNAAASANVNAGAQVRR